MIVTTIEEKAQFFPQDKWTPANRSVLGALAASIGFNSNHYQELYGLREDCGFMTTKKRTPMYLMNRVQGVTTAMSKTAVRYRMDDIPADYPDFPGCYVTARAIIHAAARNYNYAIEVYHDMKELAPQRRDYDAEARINAMEPYQAGLRNQSLILQDHPTIEGALCQMIGIKRNHLFKGGIHNENRAKHLLNGKTGWTEDEVERVILPRLEAVSERLQAAIPYALEVDETHLEAIADLSTVLTATIWQLWPTLTGVIEEASPWISVLRIKEHQPEQ